MRSQGWLALVVGIVAWGAIGFALPATAQLNLVEDTAPDRSLGTSIIPVQGFPIDLITGGARPQDGQNLFHSFQEFNVPEDRAVYFNNPAGVQNIFSRVTGTDRSDILGVLGVVGGNANLFLINPNGILFGPDASLDVGGSFVATTANAIQLGNQGLFSASVPASSNLLTIDPSAFLFNAINRQATIENQSTIQGTSPLRQQPVSGLQVPDGQNLLLLGGDVILDGGQMNAWGGRVEIGAVAGIGTVGLNIDGSLSFPSALERANVALSGEASIAGDIAITGVNINIDNSEIRSSIFGNSHVGNIHLTASEKLNISNSTVSGSIPNTTEGNAGSIFLRAKQLLVKGTDFSTSSSAFSGDGKGNAGNIEIIVDGSAVLTRGNPIIDSYDGELFTIYPETRLTSGINFGSAGEGGNIVIKSESLSLADTYIDSSTRTGGSAGDVFIQTNGSTYLERTEINVGNFNGQYVGGVAGNFTVQANSFSLTDGSEINASNVGKDDQSATQGGIVLLQIDGPVFLSGSSILNQALFSGSPEEDNAGRIEVQARSLYLTDAAEVSASTQAAAKAGSIFIKVDDFVTVTNGSVIGSFVERNTKDGIGGEIEIQSRTLTLTDGGQLNTSILGDFDYNSGGSGEGGRIRVMVADQINISGVSSTNNSPRFSGDGSLSPVGTSSGIYSQTERGASGPSGEIVISTGNLRLSDRGVISTQTFNSGAGGDITINARNFEAIGGGQVLTTAFSSGKAGNIVIDVQQNGAISGSDFSFLDRVQQVGRNVVANVSANSGVFASTDAGSTANGGSIFLKAQNLQLFESGQISAQSLGRGSAGNITIQVDNTLRANDGNIATTAQSTGGAINIGAKVIRLQGDSDITTNVANGDGGSILLTADSIIALGDSDILAFAEQGRGGNITLNTRAFFGQNYRPGSPSPFDGNNRVDINASGTVSGIITLPDVSFIQSSLTQLSQTAIDTNQLLATSCIVRRNQPNPSSFYITGPGGLPDRPRTPPTPPVPTGEIRNLATDPNPQSAAPRPWQIGDPIQEPDGVYQLPNGELILSHECR
jgi:filamentous hemagglutinin family protein